MEYRDRVADDLERWIAAGLVGAENRAAILATLPARRKVDAVTALIWVAAVLLGLAVIAFVAANWESIPRLVRFGLLLVSFLAAAVAGARASRRQRPITSDVALTVASLIFAAAIGLTGQIFELTGNPPAVPYGTGAAALALGAVGASRGALAVGMIAVLIGDLMTAQGAAPIPVALIVAPVVVAIAVRWHAAFLAHIGAGAILVVLLWFAIHYDLQGWPLFGIAGVAAALAAVGRWLPAAGPVSRILFSWFVVGGLLFFIAAGYSGAFDDNTVLGLSHRVAWIALSAALITFGSFDRQSLLTGLGVVSLIGAACGLLYDLGLDLIVISLVFLGCSAAALVVGLALRRGRSDGANGRVP